MNRELRSAEVRKVAGDGRTFEARAVSYGVIDDYQTRFVRGCFSESLKRRLPVVAWGHDWSDPIGRVTAWDDRSDGLYITGRLSDPGSVPRARQAMAQLADGTLDEVSVGFFRLEERTAADGVVEIVRGDLDEVSIVLRGAVPGAKVLAVRQGQRGRKMSAVEHELLDQAMDAALRIVSRPRDGRWHDDRRDRELIAAVWGQLGLEGHPW